MATNAVIWGGAGAAAGALLGGAHGAKVGAVVGSVLGAANTPYPGGAAIGPAPYPSAYGNCAIFPTIEEQAECKRGQNWSERVIREHRKRDAFDYGQNLPYRNYYSRYPRW
ncbi:MAG: hypothetical protein COW88_01925 [Candidatus Lloydbacteria bacterium CG22_combo_CG10-13_8_21_14_all_47_15]|uniref:Glycine zipper domain-containing protein n=1 Tax=Candidatus Lloydbacteria bacterium CG22_combo_CG10-13_8_21_14_all_47_15 TaxID=1974635 RepID=A0A2H0CU63_9BACT|nr:MAG: hypothetical protein COW88_01925 [Candidatus Lloydbacteria bacterium CG22_combo_CG10-13_8_21_14_all_47_15]